MNEKERKKERKIGERETRKAGETERGRETRRGGARGREGERIRRLRGDNNNTLHKTIRYYTSYSPTLKRDTGSALILFI